MSSNPDKVLVSPGAEDFDPESLLSDTDIAPGVVAPGDVVIGILANPVLSIAGILESISSVPGSEVQFNLVCLFSVAMDLFELSLTNTNLGTGLFETLDVLVGDKKVSSVSLKEFVLDGIKLDGVSKSKTRVLLKYKRSSL